MNKEQLEKLQISNILAKIQGFLTGNPGSSLQSIIGKYGVNVDKDGLDPKDVINWETDMVLNQTPQGQYQSILMDLNKNYDSIKKYLDESGIQLLDTIKTPNPDLARIGNILFGLMKRIKKHEDGGIIEEGDDVVIVTIGDKTYKLVVAESEEEKEEGLMGVEELDSDEGMLFDYRDEPQEEISFWMKDTYTPLDIIFVDKDDSVISVQKGIPESEDLITEYNVAYVIEVAKGSGIKTGDIVKFKTSIEDYEPNKLYVIGSDGNPQAILEGGERIFSRKSSAVIIRKARKAFESKSDIDYKDLGRYIFNEMKAQDNREPEYVEN